MANIGDIKPIEQVVEIKHPGTKSLLGIRVSMMSKDDDRLKRFKRELRNKAIQLEKRGKVADADAEDKNGKAFAFEACTGWEWYNPTGIEGDKGYDASEMPDFNGSVPEFNRKNFMEVIDELPWFLSQLGQMFDEEEGFFVNSNGS